MSAATPPLPGLLLADWDEKLGPQVLAHILPDITEDPESLAAQSYISAQQVFSSAEFSRISFILPNMKIQRKVKLYFDVIPDDTIRGGQRPFLIALFLPLSILDVFFLKVDPVIEPLLDAYKAGTRPDLHQLHADILKLFAVAQSAPEGPGEDGKTSEVLLLKVHCEICKKDLPIAFSKTELQNAPDGESAEYTYLHGVGEKTVTPHGVKITVDKNYALTKVEYVDTRGTRISPVQEQDLKDLPKKVGAWAAGEIQLLAQEMKHGTPLRSLARLFQRPVAEIERKTKELEGEKLGHFNKILAESIAAAKAAEQTNRQEAKIHWQKIIEYCLEFAASPGIAPQVAAMIRQRTQGLKARAAKL